MNCLPIKSLAAAAAMMGMGLTGAETTVYAPTNAPRAVRFAHPPAQDRILPIHHGRPHDVAKADAELDGLQDEGFGGLTCNVNFDNYLDDAASWQTLHHLVDRAHAKGMALWLYDEQGYPSGTAGGKTLVGHPEWQARAYLVAITNVPAGSAALPPAPPGKPVATVRRRSKDGQTDTVYVVTDDYILDGTHISVSVTDYKHPYPNLLLAEPTARFIELTHEAYRRKLGPSLAHFTSTFTDEPSLMTYWMRPMPYLCLPVSDDLLAAYLAAGHTRVADDIPELVRGKPVGDVAAKRHRFWSLVGERVARNYTGQLTAWADKNGLASGGHLLMEEHLPAHVPLYGDFFRVLRGLSAPGCDILTSVPEEVPWVTPLLAGSAGELNGARWVMSEASDFSQKYRPKGDTRPPCQVTPREVVGALNRQIWGGVNTFTSYYNWQTFSSDDKRAINAEIGRTLTLVREGHSAADIALLYPADTLMVGCEPAFHGAGGTGAHRTAGLVLTVGRALFTANRSFLFVDDATLAAAEIKDGCLVSGTLRWRTVVLPGVTTLPTDVARKLTAFQLAGGTVIAVGEIPVNSTRFFPDAEIDHLASTWTYLPEEYAPLLADLLAARHTPALRIVRGSMDALRTNHRRTKEGDVFYVLNDTREPWRGAVRLAQEVAARCWDPRTGTTTDTAPGEIPLDLPPFGAVVLTTDTPVDDATVANGPTTLAPRLVPLNQMPASVGFGKGQYVQGAAPAVADGWHDVDVTLTKGAVDTFAFLGFTYAGPVYAATARGVAFAVRVPETTDGAAVCGVFLTTRDGQRWYQRGTRSLSDAGEAELVFAFSAFAPFGERKGSAAKLRPEDIVRVEFGFGGYFGREGERVHFHVSPPRALLRP